MHPAVQPTLFARLTRRTVRSRRQPEPADMGTAFGMEQWLDERDQVGQQAVAQPARKPWLPRWLAGATSR